MTAISRVDAIPQEVHSSFMRAYPAAGITEYHKYVSINGGIPKHFIYYQVYNKQGGLEKAVEPSFDRMV